MMKLNALISAVLALGLALTPAAYGSEALELASNGCFARGEAVAAQRGATLVGAEAVQQGSRQMCKIVLLVQGEAGERPRREEVFVDP